MGSHTMQQLKIYTFDELKELFETKMKHVSTFTSIVQVKDISIKDLKNQLEEALKEKDDLKLKLEKFEESSKNHTKLINSQISAKDKAGLGYDSQINKSEVVHSVFNSRVSDVDNSPVNDRFKTGEGFHAVPLPYTRNYMPLRPDLSFVGLDDSVYKTKVSETTTTASKTNHTRSNECLKLKRSDHSDRDTITISTPQLMLVRIACEMWKALKKVETKVMSSSILPTTYRMAKLNAEQADWNDDTDESYEQ
ncbi:hypothetical protein Tco_1246915 [Tanacetum coccineum]